MNFSVDNGLLLANGRQIFPPPPPSRISAIQHRESDGQDTDPIPLGYALEMMPLPTSPEESDVELLEVRFTVLDLDSHPVPMDTVAITLVHEPEGSIYMAKTDVEETAPNRVSWKQCRGKPSCLRTLLLTRMRDLFASAKARMLKMGSRLSGGKGCHGKHHGPKPMHDGPHHHGFGPGPFHAPGEEPPSWGQGPPPSDGHHLPHHPHMHHHHHFHHGGLRRTISRIFRFIVIPAALGILAGLAASALGMLIGQVVIFFWLRYRRSTSKKTTANLEQGTVSEKQVLMVDSTEDVLPQYTDEDSGNVSEEKN